MENNKLSRDHIGGKEEFAGNVPDSYRGMEKETCTKEGQILGQEEGLKKILSILREKDVNWKDKQPEEKEVVTD